MTAYSPEERRTFAGAAIVDSYIPRLNNIVDLLEQTRELLLELPDGELAQAELRVGELADGYTLLRMYLCAVSGIQGVSDQVSDAEASKEVPFAARIKLNQECQDLFREVCEYNDWLMEVIEQD